MRVLPSPPLAAHGPFTVTTLVLVPLPRLLGAPSPTFFLVPSSHPLMSTPLVTCSSLPTPTLHPSAPYQHSSSFPSWIIWFCVLVGSAFPYLRYLLSHVGGCRYTLPRRHGLVSVIGSCCAPTISYDYDITRYLRPTISNIFDGDPCNVALGVLTTLIQSLAFPTHDEFHSTAGVFAYIMLILGLGAVSSVHPMWHVVFSGQDITYVGTRDPPVDSDVTCVSSGPSGLQETSSVFMYICVNSSLFCV